MRCPQCASEIPDNNDLCPNCGSLGRPLISQDRALGDGIHSQVFPLEGNQPGHPPELSLTQEQQQFLQKLYTRKVNVTYLIIAINLFLFLLLELNGGSKNSRTLIEFGARYNASIAEGQYWRLLTNTFLHAGYLHIIFNMYGLFNLGSIIERLYGPTRFLFLYLASGIVGSVISWQASNYLSVGASGAVFGIAGVMIVYGYKHKKTIPREMTADFGRGAIPFVALNLYLGFSHPQIDNYAHIGGLLAGMLLSALMNPTEERAITEQLGQKRPWTNLAMQATSIVLLLYGSIPAVRNYQPQKRLHQADVSFQEGTRLIQQGKLDQAVAEFKKAIAINPNSAQFHLGLGSAYLSLGQTEDAIREYEQSLQIRPNAPEAYFNLGIAWNRQGATDKAIAAYQESIRLKPDLVPAYFDLGMLYLNTQHAPSAEQVFQDLLKAKPVGESHLVIGQAYLSANRDELAIEHFRKAIEMKPDLAEAHFFLGNALMKSNHKEEAVESYRRVLDLNRNFAPAKTVLSRVLAQDSIAYLQKGKWGEAQVRIGEIFKIDPSNSEAHLLLGAVYAGKKQFAQAVGEYEKFLKLVPNAPNAAKIRQEIDRLQKLQG